MPVTLFTIGYERLRPESLAAELGRTAPAALLCLEANPAGCHRRVLAEALLRRRPELRVVDL